MSEATRTDLLSIGYKGATFISGTDSHVGLWRKIVAIEDTVFATLTDSQLDGDTIIGETIPKSFELTGHFTEIDLTSGAVIAYK